VLLLLFVGKNGEWMRTNLHFLQLEGNAMMLSMTRLRRVKKSDKELKKEKDLGEVLTENFVKKSLGCPCGVAWTNVFRVL
jgi:hypothetical protein